MGRTSPQTAGSGAEKWAHPIHSPLLLNKPPRVPIPVSRPCLSVCSGSKGESISCDRAHKQVLTLLSESQDPGKTHQLHAVLLVSPESPSAHSEGKLCLICAQPSSAALFPGGLTAAFKMDQTTASVIEGRGEEKAACCTLSSPRDLTSDLGTERGTSSGQADRT